jgi:hypothetical protein
MSYGRAVVRAKQPWLLVTSIENQPPDAVTRLYATRMQIEEVYRDTKNHRWGWSLEDARSRSPERYEVLLLIATIANLALTAIGLAAEQASLHRSFQANTVSTRRVLSLFFLGAQILRQPKSVRITAKQLRRAREMLQQLIGLTHWAIRF